MTTVPDRTRTVDIDFADWPAPAPPAAAGVATELEEFHRYLSKLLAGGVDPLAGRIGDVSIDAVLAQFRIYQDKLRQMREALRPALERHERGEDTSISWDREKFMADLRDRLAKKGISLDEST